MAKKQTKTSGDGKSKLSMALDSLSSLFKEDYSIELNYKEPMPHLPTGSLVIDHLIGGRKNVYGISPCPGIPKGRVTNLAGEPSTGKTTLALMAAAQTNKNGGSVLYIDWEQEIAPAYAISLGCSSDPNYFRVFQPPTLEEGIAALCYVADMGIDLIVVDSVGAGIPKKLFDQAVDEIGKEQRMGLQAAIWSKYLPKIKGIIGRSGTAVLGISQLRATFSTMPSFGGPQKDAQGGNAWKFYSALRIMLKKLKSEKTNIENALTKKKESQVTGTGVRVVLTKNKVSDSQNQSLDVFLRWGLGFDNVRSVIDILVNYGFIKKNASSYVMELSNGDQVTGRGVDAFRQKLVDNPALYAQLEALAIEKLRSAEPFTNVTSSGEVTENDEEDIIEEDEEGEDFEGEE